MEYDLCIIGGAGHIGLPLGVVFANAGVSTALFDINKEALQTIQAGKFPFKEKGGEKALQEALKKNTLFVTDSPEAISSSKAVIIVVGTPVDRYLSPRLGELIGVMDKYFDYFRDGQLLILRSTVYPGTTENLQKYFLGRSKNVKIAFCPERITQSYAIEELKRLPQIVSAFDEETLHEVIALFRKITPAKIIPVKPVDAELAKLFTNAWRYIRFAAANQFFMIAQDHGLDYQSIERAMKEDYERNKDLPSPGFAAGPCLLKDTMQLAAFTNNNFSLGHAAMLVNEGLANHLVKSLRYEYGPALREKTVGILGMAFKAEVDDPRDSLSYKLKKLFEVECKKVLCTDPYIKHPDFVSVEQVLENADAVVLAAPHMVYARVNPKSHPQVKFVDVWNFWKVSSKKRVLITGAAGFIGYHLARHLLEKYGNECEFVLVDNLQKGGMDEEFKNLIEDRRISFKNLDLTDPKMYGELGENYDHVYHLAAINHTQLFYEIPHKVLRTNTLSLIHMLDWFQEKSGKGKFCFTSSNEAYAGALNAFGTLPLPTPENVPLVIEDPKNPRWSYAATKLVGELFVNHYAKMHNFRALIVRPHNFYGPRAGHGGHVIPDFAERIAKQIDPFPIYGADDTRTFCYISDAVRAMSALMDSPQTDKQPIETVHIGDFEEITMQELAHKMFEIANWRPQSLDIKNSPSGSVKRRLANITKLQGLTGWKPEVPLMEGLKRTYDWYLKHPRSA